MGTFHSGRWQVAGQRRSRKCAPGAPPRAKIPTAWGLIRGSPSRQAVRPTAGAGDCRAEDLIPLGDSIGGRRQPIVTIGLIGVCCLVFVFELTLGGGAL